MSQSVLNKTKKEMKAAEKDLSYELGTIRAGRANASLLDNVTVSYYGADTPLNQLAQISVPEPRLIVIAPYDKGTIEEIEKGINKSDLGITPSNDGEVVRLVVPQLTEERRQEIAKRVGEEEEEAKIAVRNIRRSAMDDLEELENAGDISEDEEHRFEKEVQKLTDNSVERIEELAAEKEKEITSV
ncbi:MAG: ribosome recycling factor [Atopostipes sp.]|nr:ribosome recycling factor [Atopostipes sp.]